MIVAQALAVAAEDDWACRIYGSSGTAIGPRHVLSSVHQMALGPGGTGEPAFPEAVVKGATYPVIAWHLHSDFDAALSIIDGRLESWHALDFAPLVQGEAILVSGIGRYSALIPGSIADGAPGWEWPAAPVWATNTVDLAMFPGEAGRGWGAYLDAPASGAPPTEGCAAQNDSGGGVFTLDSSGRPVLRGVITGGVSAAAGLGAYDYGASMGGLGLTYLRPWLMHLLAPRLTVALSTPGGAALAQWRAREPWDTAPSQPPPPAA